MQLYVCLSYRIGAPSTWSSWSAWSCTVCGSRSGVLNRHRTCTGTCTYTCAINSTSTALGANCSGGERVTSAGLWNLAIYFYFYALIEEVVGGKRGIIGLGEHGKERAKRGRIPLRHALCDRTSTPFHTLFLSGLPFSWSAWTTTMPCNASCGVGGFVRRERNCTGSCGPPCDGVGVVEEACTFPGFLRRRGGRGSFLAFSMVLYNPDLMLERGFFMS